MERQVQIFQTAQAHEGRYLLPRRYWTSIPPRDIDLDYAACQSLVDGGYAQWLSAGGAGPGIRLTGKPLSNPLA